MDSDQVRANRSEALIQLQARRMEERGKCTEIFLRKNWYNLHAVGGADSGVGPPWMSRKMESSEDGAGIQVLVR